MTFAVDHLENGVALVTLSAVSSRNAFSTDSMQMMAEIFEGLLDDLSVRAIVMTGTGRFFCSGADIDEFASCIDDGTIGEVVDNLTGILHPLELKIRGSETVFIAAINGAAAGGGLGLALVADYRVCVPQAKLAPAFFSLGLSPDGGTTWLLPRLVGSQRAKRFFFDNKPWTGEQALEFGAVDELAEPDDLVERAVSIAAKWGSWAEMSRRSTKQLLDASTSTFMETQLEFERALITASSLTPDFAEGITAFLEKRKPVFGVFEEE
jgi:2-(1,2-epoxy-1,2-dihydrophenyl)acetyl-CoA isomerase